MTEQRRAGRAGDGERGPRAEDCERLQIEGAPAGPRGRARATAARIGRLAAVCTTGTALHHLIWGGRHWRDHTRVLRRRCAQKGGGDACTPTAKVAVRQQARRIKPNIPHDRGVSTVQVVRSESASAASSTARPTRCRRRHQRQHQDQNRQRALRAAAGGGSAPGQQLWRQDYCHAAGQPAPFAVVGETNSAAPRETSGPAQPSSMVLDFSWSSKGGCANSRTSTQGWCWRSPTQQTPRGRRRGVRQPASDYVRFLNGAKVACTRPVFLRGRSLPSAAAWCRSA